MNRDLGTYHLRVEFTDGTGYLHAVATGRRYAQGSGSCHPLNAPAILPMWAAETEFLDEMVYLYVAGNYSCDCNRQTFLAAAAGLPDPQAACGNTLKLKRLTAIRPAGDEMVIYNQPNTP